MKKIILSILLSFSALCCFAIEKKYDSLGFTFSSPVVMDFASSNGTKSSGIIPSIAFGIQGTTLYSDKFGLYSSVDFFLPFSISTTITSGGSKTTLKATRDQYKSLWGMSLLFGPAIVLSKTEKGLFLISPGIHYNMLLADGTSTVLTHTFGVGANIQYNFFFGSNGFFNVGGDVAFDFLGFANAGGNTNSLKAVSFMFAPKVGVGFRFY